MKKLITLFLVFAGMVGTAKADYYVVGDLSSWTYTPSLSNSTAMSSSSSDGFYYFDCTPTEGTKYFCIADNDGTGGDWTDFNANHRYASATQNLETNGGVYSVALSTNNGDQNLKLTADGATTYRIILDATNSSALKLTVTKLNQNYIAAGAFRHDLTNDYSTNPIFTTNWDIADDSNALTLQADGTYAKTYTGVVLPVGGDIVYKIVKDNNWDTSTSSNQTYRVYTAGTYDITITLYIDNLNGPVISVTETTSGGDFFLLSNWSVSDEALVDNGDNTYSKTFVNSKGYTFIIAPKAAIASSISWNDCVRPEDFITVNFENYSETKYDGTGGSQNWTINTDETVTFTYNNTTGNWSINCAPRSATIGEAGYITYSNGEMCTVTGATAYIVSANNTSSVTLTEMPSATIWPASEGMILKGSNGTTVTVNPVANNATPTTIDTNFLVGSGNSSTTPSTGDNYYVFSWDGSDASTVGFYKASGGDLDAHKAYLNLGKYTSAREFLSFSFGDESTGINEAKTAQNDGIIYNLQGVRQSQLQKGLNIVNGRKVMVK